MNNSDDGNTTDESRPSSDGGSDNGALEEKSASQNSRRRIPQSKRSKQRILTELDIELLSCNIMAQVVRLRGKVGTGPTKAIALEESLNRATAYHRTANDNLKFKSVHEFLTYPDRHGDKVGDPLSILAASGISRGLGWSYEIPVQYTEPKATTAREELLGPADILAMDYAHKTHTRSWDTNYNEEIESLTIETKKDKINRLGSQFIGDDKWSESKYVQDEIESDSFNHRLKEKFEYCCVVIKINQLDTVEQLTIPQQENYKGSLDNAKKRMEYEIEGHCQAFPQDAKKGGYVNQALNIAVNKKKQEIDKIYSQNLYRYLNKNLDSLRASIEEKYRQLIEEGGVEEIKTELLEKITNIQSSIESISIAGYKDELLELKEEVKKEIEEAAEKTTKEIKLSNKAVEDYKSEMINARVMLAGENYPEVSVEGRDKIAILRERKSILQQRLQRVQALTITVPNESLLNKAKRVGLQEDVQREFNDTSRLQRRLIQEIQDEGTVVSRAIGEQGRITHQENISDLINRLNDKEDKIKVGSLENIEEQISELQDIERLIPRESTTNTAEQNKDIKTLKKRVRERLKAIGLLQELAFDLNKKDDPLIQENFSSTRSRSQLNTEKEQAKRKARRVQANINARQNLHDSEKELLKNKVQEINEAIEKSAEDREKKFEEFSRKVEETVKQITQRLQGPWENLSTNSMNQLLIRSLEEIEILKKRCREEAPNMSAMDDLLQCEETLKREVQTLEEYLREYNDFKNKLKQKDQVLEELNKLCNPNKLGIQQDIETEGVNDRRLDSIKEVLISTRETLQAKLNQAREELSIPPGLQDKAARLGLDLEDETGYRNKQIVQIRQAEAGLSKIDQRLEEIESAKLGLRAKGEAEKNRLKRLLAETSIGDNDDVDALEGKRSVISEITPGERIYEASQQAEIDELVRQLNDRSVVIGQLIATNVISYLREGASGELISQEETSENLTQRIQKIDSLIQNGSQEITCSPTDKDEITKLSAQLTTQKNDLVKIQKILKSLNRININTFPSDLEKIEGKKQKLIAKTTNVQALLEEITDLQAHEMVQGWFDAKVEEINDHALSMATLLEIFFDCEGESLAEIKQKHTACQEQLNAFSPSNEETPKDIQRALVKKRKELEGSANDALRKLSLQIDRIEVLISIDPNDETDHVLSSIISQYQDKTRILDEYGKDLEETELKIISVVGSMEEKEAELIESRDLRIKELFKHKLDFEVDFTGFESIDEIRQEEERLRVEVSNLIEKIQESPLSSGEAGQFAEDKQELIDKANAKLDSITQKSLAQQEAYVSADDHFQKLIREADFDDTSMSRQALRKAKDRAISKLGDALKVNKKREPRLRETGATEVEEETKRVKECFTDKNNRFTEFNRNVSQAKEEVQEIIGALKRNPSPDNCEVQKKQIEEIIAPLRKRFKTDCEESKKVETEKFITDSISEIQRIKEAGSLCRWYKENLGKAEVSLASLNQMRGTGEAALRAIKSKNQSSHKQTEVLISLLKDERKKLLIKKREIGSLDLRGPDSIPNLKRYSSLLGSYEEFKKTAPTLLKKCKQDLDRANGLIIDLERSVTALEALKKEREDAYITNIQDLGSEITGTSISDIVEQYTEHNKELNRLSSEISRYYQESVPESIHQAIAKKKMGLDTRVIESLSEMESRFDPIIARGIGPHQSRDEQFSAIAQDYLEKHESLAPVFDEVFFSAEFPTSGMVYHKTQEIIKKYDNASKRINVELNAQIYSLITSTRSDYSKAKNVDVIQQESSSDLEFLSSIESKLEDPDMGQSIGTVVRTALSSQKEKILLSSVERINSITQFEAVFSLEKSQLKERIKSLMEVESEEELLQMGEMVETLRQEINDAKERVIAAFYDNPTSQLSADIESDFGQLTSEADLVLSASKEIKGHIRSIENAQEKMKIQFSSLSSLMEESTKAKTIKSPLHSTEPKYRTIEELRKRKNHCLQKVKLLNELKTDSIDQMKIDSYDRGSYIALPGAESLAEKYHQQFSEQKERLISLFQTATSALQLEATDLSSMEMEYEFHEDIDRTIRTLNSFNFNKQRSRSQVHSLKDKSLARLDELTRKVEDNSENLLSSEVQSVLLNRILEAKKSILRGHDKRMETFQLYEKGVSHYIHQISGEINDLGHKSEEEQGEIKLRVQSELQGFKEEFEWHGDQECRMPLYEIEACQFELESTLSIIQMANSMLIPLMEECSTAVAENYTKHNDLSTQQQNLAQIRKRLGVFLKEIDNFKSHVGEQQLSCPASDSDSANFILAGPRDRILARVSQLEQSVNVQFEEVKQKLRQIDEKSRDLQREGTALISNTNDQIQSLIISDDASIAEAKVLLQDLKYKLKEASGKFTKELNQQVSRRLTLIENTSHQIEVIEQQKQALGQITINFSGCDTSESIERRYQVDIIKLDNFSREQPTLTVNGASDHLNSHIEQKRDFLTDYYQVLKSLSGAKHELDSISNKINSPPALAWENMDDLSLTEHGRFLNEEKIALLNLLDAANKTLPEPSSEKLQQEERGYVQEHLLLAMETDSKENLLALRHSINQAIEIIDNQQIEISSEKNKLAQSSLILIEINELKKEIYFGDCNNTDSVASRESDLKDKLVSLFQKIGGMDDSKLRESDKAKLTTQANELQRFIESGKSRRLKTFTDFENDFREGLDKIDSSLNALKNNDVSFSDKDDLQADLQEIIRDLQQRADDNQHDTNEFPKQTLRTRLEQYESRITFTIAKVKSAKNYLLRKKADIVAQNNKLSEVSPLTQVSALDPTTLTEKSYSDLVGLLEDYERLEAQIRENNDKIAEVVLTDTSDASVVLSILTDNSAKQLSEDVSALSQQIQYKHELLENSSQAVSEHLRLVSARITQLDKEAKVLVDSVRHEISNMTVANQPEIEQRVERLGELNEKLGKSANNCSVDIQEMIQRLSPRITKLQERLREFKDYDTSVDSSKPTDKLSNDYDTKKRALEDIRWKYVDSLPKVAQALLDTTFATKKGMLDESLREANHQSLRAELTQIMGLVPDFNMLETKDVVLSEAENYIARLNELVRKVNRTPIFHHEKVSLVKDIRERSAEIEIKREQRLTIFRQSAKAVSDAISEMRTKLSDDYTTFSEISQALSLAERKFDEENKNGQVDQDQFATLKEDFQGGFSELNSAKLQAQQVCDDYTNALAQKANELSFRDPNIIPGSPIVLAGTPYSVLEAEHNRLHDELPKYLAEKERIGLVVIQQPPQGLGAKAQKLGRSPSPQAEFDTLVEKRGRISTVVQGKIDEIKQRQQALNSAMDALSTEAQNLQQTTLTAIAGMKFTSSDEISNKRLELEELNQALTQDIDKYSTADQLSINKLKNKIDALVQRIFELETSNITLDGSKTVVEIESDYQGMITVIQGLRNNTTKALPDESNDLLDSIVAIQTQKLDRSRKVANYQSLTDSISDIETLIPNIDTMSTRVIVESKAQELSRRLTDLIQTIKSTTLDSDNTDALLLKTVALATAVNDRRDHRLSTFGLSEKAVIDAIDTMNAQLADAATTYSDISQAVIQAQLQFNQDCVDNKFDDDTKASFEKMLNDALAKIAMNEQREKSECDDYESQLARQEKKLGFKKPIAETDITGMTYNQLQDELNSLDREVLNYETARNRITNLNFIEPTPALTNQGVKLARTPLPADTFSRVSAKKLRAIFNVEQLISKKGRQSQAVRDAQVALDDEAEDRLVAAGQYKAITIAPLDDLTEVIRKKDNLVSMKQDLIADYEKFQSKHQIQMDDLAGNIQLKIDDFEMLSQVLQELEGLPNHYDNCQDFESLKEESERIERDIKAIIAKYNKKLLSDSSTNLAQAIVNKENLLARQFQDRAKKVPASSPQPPQVPPSTPPSTPPQPNTRGSPTRHTVYGNTHLKQWSDDDFAALFVSLNKVSTGEAKPEDLVIAINYLEHELSDDEERALLSEKGQALQSPSGQNFVFTLANDVPKAILTAADSEKRASESQFQHQQRTAVTMMTMIDNVVAKGNVVEVDTEDPFLAKIAIDYLSYLKNEKGMSLAVTTVNGADIAEPIKIKGALPTDSDKTNDAFTNAALIFDKIKPSVEREIDKAAWFKAAKTIHQESLNDAANKGSNASTSQSPPTTHNKQS